MSASPDAEVISIRSHTGYRADYQGLASAQVTSARAKLGLSLTEFAGRLAELVGWHPAPAVVERWEHGSTPPGDVVLAAAVMMQEVPGDVLTLPLSRDAARRADLMSALSPALDFSEAVKPYADRGVVTRQQWNGIISGSADEVWLYGMAEFGYASDDEVPGILKKATAQGCRARVLLLDPDYPGIEQIDLDEGSPAGTLAARTRAALVRFQQMQNACTERMQVRTYSAPPTVSVVRGDGQMLVTPYLRFFVGSNSPTFEIWAKTAPKMSAAMSGTSRTHGIARRTGPDMTVNSTEACTMKDGRLVSTEVLLPKPKRFVRETLEMPDGYALDWYYVDCPASVMVVPVTADGLVILVRQYRHNLRGYGLELPAGNVGKGEEPEKAARRELEEETGYVLRDGTELLSLGSFYSLPSETNKYTHVFLARPVVSVGEPVLDTEIEKYFDMSVLGMPIEEVFASVGSAIRGMETTGALMLARNLISQ